MIITPEQKVRLSQLSISLKNIKCLIENSKENNQITIKEEEILNYSLEDLRLGILDAYGIIDRKINSEFAS